MQMTPRKSCTQGFANCDADGLEPGLSAGAPKLTIRTPYIALELTAFKPAPAFGIFL
jgi:hypothetical protein